MSATNITFEFFLTFHSNAKIHQYLDHILLRYPSYLSTPISILLALKDGWIYRYIYRYFHPWVDAIGVKQPREHLILHMWKRDDCAAWIEYFSHPSSASSYTLGRTLLGKNSKTFWSSLWIVFAYVLITNVDVVMIILKFKIRRVWSLPLILRA